jgi:hypothetical protein
MTGGRGFGLTILSQEMIAYLSQEMIAYLSQEMIAFFAGPRRLLLVLGIPVS